MKREFKEEAGLGVTVGDIIDGRIEVPFDRIKVIVDFEVFPLRAKPALTLRMKRTAGLTR